MKGCVRIALVQPVQSPYWTERLKWLGEDQRVCCTLLLERESFSHRPGWKPTAIKGVDIQVLGSSLVAQNKKDESMGFSFKEVRSIPWSLFLWLFKERPDLLVVCNATQILISWIPVRMLGVKMALIVEDTLYANRNLKGIKKWVKRFAYRRADSWFAFSSDARNYLNSFGITHNIVRTSWSVDVKRFSSAKEKSKTAGKERVVLFVGALTERKGILKLIESWQKINLNVREGWRLMIVGSGPLEKRVRQLAGDEKSGDILCMGQMDYQSVIDMYKKSRLLVLPTLQDLFSLTVVEAIASGCAVITTPYNGARELVKEGENGWIADPLKEGELQSVLEQALSSEELLEEMGKKSLEIANELDNHKVMNRFADALVKMAAEK